MYRQALSGSGKDLGSKTCCVTCQRPGQCPVVCVPRPGQEKRAGKSSEPGESPNCWRWQLSTQSGCLCLCSAQALSPTCQIMSGWPRPAVILRWLLPSPGVSGGAAGSVTAEPRARQQLLCPIPTPELSRTPHRGLRACPASSCSLGSSARVT